MERGTDARIARVLELMRQQFASPWRIAQLAAIAELSPSRFAHLFEIHVGMAPLRYLQHLRLEQARILLERTSLRIADVMRSVGYSDASHFSKDFRRRFGAGPRDYRRDYLSASGRYARAAAGDRAPGPGDRRADVKPPCQKPGE